MLFKWNDRLLDHDVYIPWQFLKALLYYNLSRKCIKLCCWLAIVVCCYRRDVIVQVGLVSVEGCGVGSIIESTYSVCCCVIQRKVMCVIHVKYCNHLLAVDVAGVACRGLWCACGWKNVKRYRDGSP